MAPMPVLPPVMKAVRPSRLKNIDMKFPLALPQTYYDLLTVTQNVLAFFTNVYRCLEFVLPHNLF